MAKIKRIMLPAILPAVLLVMIMWGCGRREQRPFAWPSVSPRIDTLSQRIDRIYFTRGNPDTLRRAITVLSAAADRLPADAALHNRILFFRALLQRREGSPDAADRSFRAIMAKTDSAADPYLFHRLRYMITDVSGRSKESYDTLSSLSDYFRSVGDMFMTGALSMDMGNFMKDCGDYGEALHLYTMADSLYRKARLPGITRYNDINRASALAMSGDSVAAGNLLRGLLASADLPIDTGLRAVIDRNIYVYTGDTAALHEIYLMLPPEEVPPMVDAFMSVECHESGDAATAMTYARQSLDKASDEGDAEAYAMALALLSELYHAAGDNNNAYSYLSDYVELLNQINVARDREAVISHTSLRAITADRIEKEQRATRRRLVSVMALLSLTVAGVVAALFILQNSRLNRRRRKEIAMERDKMHRRLVALQAVIVEKDRIIKEVGKENTAVRSHMGHAPERGLFIDTFAEIHPGFAEALRQRNPDITDSDIRLACLITMGMDNKQIASVLGIRHESVKQARWRLRSKLALQTSDSLEHTLHALTL